MAILNIKPNTYLKKITLKEFSKTITFIFLVILIFGFLSALNIVNKGNRSLTVPALGVSIILLVAFKKYLTLQDKKLNPLIKGLKGEQTVEHVLTQLPDGYTVYNDIVLGKQNGNIDFVVVGPNGVFIIEVKNISGEITFDGNQLLQNGKPMKKDYLFQANKEYEVLHNYLLNQGLNIFVTPLLVFNRYAKIRMGSEKVNNVTVIGLSWLNKTITEREPRGYLNTEIINQALKNLQTHSY